MGEIHDLLHKRRHLTALKCHKILILPAGFPVLIIIIPLVDDILRSERIPGFLFKLFQYIRGNRCGIPVPVHIFFPFQFIKDQGKLMKKCSITNHIHIRVFFHKPAQTRKRMGMGFGLTHVKGDLMFHPLPVIDHRIVHMNRIPDQISEEAHRIFMPGHRLFQDHTAVFLLILPLLHRHRCSETSVHHFPPAFPVIPGINHQKFVADPFHQRNL